MDDRCQYCDSGMVKLGAWYDMWMAGYFLILSECWYCGAQREQDTDGVRWSPPRKQVSEAGWYEVEVFALAA